MDKPIAWYDPSNGVVSTDKDSPLFTPLGQVWGLYLKEEAKDKPAVWGASALSKPEYIAEQKEKTKELRKMMDESVQTIPNFDQLQQIVNNLERCLTRDSKHEFLRVWIRDWTEHKLSKHTPPQRTWVGLTLEEILETYRGPDGSDYVDYARGIEAKLKEKNT
jgi:hypothetical protein